MKPIDILGLKNFRIFDAQEGFLEEFSSINILTGANNSGKSSIVKVLQLLKNSVKESKYPFDLDLNQQEHLLGDFDNILNDKNNRKVDITLPFLFMGMKNIFINLVFEAPNTHNTYKAKLRSIKVGDKGNKKIFFSFCYRDATQDEIDLDAANFKTELEVFNNRKNGAVESETDIFAAHRFYFAPSENPLSGYIEWEINLEKMKDFLEDLLKFYDIYIEHKKAWNADSFEWADNVAKDMDITPSAVVRSFKQEADTTKWKDFLDNTIGDQTELRGQEKVGERDYDSDDYFIPPYTTEAILYYKVYDILKANLKWKDQDGEQQDYSVIEHCFNNSWDNLIQRLLTVNFVSNIKGENARSYHAGSNSPFVNLLKSYDTDDFLDTSFVKKYLKEFEIGKNISLEFNPKYQTILVSITSLDGKKRELVDYGYGIKQLIIILIQISVLAEKNKSYEHGYDHDGEFIRDRYELSLLIVEEPESNLHPKWQSLLADMFVQANREFNIQFVIETHSEYLIRRFQTLVAEKAFDAKDVSIFYLRNPQFMEGGKKQIERIKIEDDGSIDFKAFDSGFFDENYNLQLSLLNIQRDQFFKDFEALKNAYQESEDKLTASESKNQANENQLNVLQQRIDAYISKADLSNYRQIITTQFPDATKLASLTIDYLVGGQYLLAHIDNASDFSPVIMQYGRAIENELKQIFIAIAPTVTWMFGPMQKCLEKLTNPSISLDGRYQNGFNGLQAELKRVFNVPGNLRIDLIEDLRQIRNDAGHAGVTKSKQDALNYIAKADEFLEKWLIEKK
jgi:hypothetical protein